MSKIVRVQQKQFGVLGPSGDFGIFGSKANPPQTFSMDPASIQSLPAFLTGWGASIIGNYEPPMEDMNSLFLLAFRQLCYIFQEGIVEWETNTIYYIGGIVKVNGVIYNSLTDNNSGNNPITDSTNWAQGFGGVNGGVPTGAILAWGGMPNAVPAGYILGDGSAISRTTYTNLFNVIGTKYGPGNGTTTFNLPNGSGRVLVGTDGTAEFLTIGQVGGEKYHQLTIAELTSHTHHLNLAVATGGNGAFIGPNGNSGIYTPTIDPAGGDQPHNNLQPYLVVGGCIVKI